MRDGRRLRPDLLRGPRVAGLIVVGIVLVGLLFQAIAFPPLGGARFLPPAEAGTPAPPASASAYLLTFVERGLPSGSPWVVALQGTGVSPSSNSSSTNEINFTASNGTYSFTVSSRGYVPSPDSGNVTVRGENTTVRISFHSRTAVVYPVTFRETGAPVSARAAVILNDTGPIAFGTGAVVTFYEPNGSYAYVVANGTGAGVNYTFESGVPLSPVVVAGIGVNVTVTLQAAFTIAFSQVDLPPGIQWTVTVGDTTGVSTTGFLNISEPNDTYSVSISTIRIYSATPNASSLFIQGSPVEFRAHFVSISRTLYPVVFRESGLPEGAHWGLTINETPFWSLAGMNVSTQLPADAYPWTIFDVPGWHESQFPYFPYSGEFVVSNGPVTEPIIYFTQVTYNVSINETGLPRETSWSVAFNGTAYTALTGSSIRAALPNGSFAYSIHDVPGWHQSTLPYSGNGTVDGTPVTEPTLVFTQMNYSIAFAETGLPAGTHWSVNLSGATQSSDTTSVVFTEPNGTYGYVISSPGYRAQPTRGNLTVNGTSPRESVSFTATKFAVTFTETGLPSGTNWSVTLDNLTQSSTGASLQFSAPNGTHSFTVTGISGYTASPSSGSLTVAGATFNQTVTFTLIPPKTYTVTFAETGLRTGTGWSVVLNGTSRSSSGSTVEFTELNGSYPFSVGSPGWQPSPAAGNVTVNGSDASVSIQFVRVTYAVTFTETGLPSGTNWSITLNDSTRTSTTGTLNFSEPNGSFPYSVGTVGGFRASPATGLVSVNGTAVRQTITFTTVSPTTYTVTFTETGLLNGTSWSVSLNGTRESSPGPAISFTEPNGSYRYAVSAPGWQPTPGSGTVEVNGSSPSVAIRLAEVTYPVVFTETGLPTGTRWSVTLNGGTLTSAGGTIAFAEPNGSYSYTVASPGYQPNPGSGTLALTGAGFTVAVNFVAAQYSVTLVETGLPPGTNWSVTLAGLTTFSVTTSIEFAEPNGSYSYALGSVVGFSGSPSSGTVSVQGAPVSISLLFTAVTYAITFTETGLPTGTSWSVSLNGTAESSSGSMIQFTRPNGTYAYAIGGVPGWTASQYAGSVTVNGAVVNEATGFTQVTYTVTFVESGLPSGATWSVRLGTSIASSTTNTVTFAEPNGTYAYTITDVPGWHQRSLPYTGSVMVDGATVNEAIVFLQVTYTVTFSESGLPSGITWSVTLGGSTLSATTSTITFMEPNGTYRFTVGSLSGFTVTSTAGNLTLHGGPQTQALTFSTSGGGGASSGFLGLSGTTGYYLLGAVVAVVLVAIGFAWVLWARRR